MAQRSPRTGSVRTSVLAVRVQPEHRRAIEDAAVAAGLTVSAYIAKTLTHAQVSPGAMVNTAVNNEPPIAARANDAVNMVSPTAGPTRPAVNSAPSTATHADPAVNMGKMLAGFAQGSVNSAPPAIDFSRLADSLGSMPVTIRGPAVNKPYEADPRAFAIKFRQQPGGLSQAALDEIADRVNKPVAPAPIDPADPAVLYELRRIGNNINQIAHAVNAHLPPDAGFAVETFHHLFEALTDAEEYRRRIAALRMRNDFNGTAHPQTRSEL